MRLSLGSSPTLAMRASSLGYLWTPSGGESGASGVSIRCDDLEGDWLSSDGIPPFSWGFWYGLPLPPLAP